MLHEPQLLGGDLRIGHEGAVVGDQGLELATEIASLDPVDHESSEAGSSGNSVVGVDEVKVVADVFPALDEVVVRGSSCLQCQCRGELGSEQDTYPSCSGSHRSARRPSQCYR